MSLLTLPDFYYRRFGRGPESITSLIMVLSFIVLIAGNFAASGFILSTVFGIESWLAVLVPALIVLTYTYAGGLFSSAYTDIFQTYIAIIAFWSAFVFFALGFSGTPYSTVLHSVPPTYLDLSGLTSIRNGALTNWASILALGLGDVVALDFMERIFASRDGGTARRSALMGATLTALTIIPVSMLGVSAIYFLPSLADPYSAYPHLAMRLVPFPIGALLLMGVLGASMSSANGGLLAISSVISRNLIQRDIVRGLLKKPAMEDSRLLTTARTCTIPIVATAVLLAYAIARPGVYLVLAFDIVFAGAWASLTFGLFWKKANTPAAIASLFTGSLLRLLLVFIVPSDLHGLETIIAPVCSSAIFIITALTTQKRHPGQLRYGVVSYIPPERDLVTGDDLRGYIPIESMTS
jgi:Na+/proline symporter